LIYREASIEIQLFCRIVGFLLVLAERVYIRWGIVAENR
jgi:hypothetical protein